MAEFMRRYDLASSLAVVPSGELAVPCTCNPLSRAGFPVQALEGASLWDECNVESRVPARRGLVNSVRSGRKQR